VVVGLGAQICTPLEVWVLGVGMSTLGTKTSLYTEHRGIQVPMTLEHDKIVGTQCCDTLSHASHDLTRELWLLKLITSPCVMSTEFLDIRQLVQSPDKAFVSSRSRVSEGR
jgi:hypothetical protein